MIGFQHIKGISQMYEMHFINYDALYWCYLMMDFPHQWGISKIYELRFIDNYTLYLSVLFNDGFSTLSGCIHPDLWTALHWLQ